MPVLGSGISLKQLSDPGMLKLRQVMRTKESNPWTMSNFTHDSPDPSMPAGTTEAFCDGDNAAFGFFGGVPRSILCDKTTIGVAKICGDGKRERTKTFAGLQSQTPAIA